MTSFTVASGPITFGGDASDNDLAFFGGTGQQGPMPDEFLATQTSWPASQAGHAASTYTHANPLYTEQLWETGETAFNEVNPAPNAATLFPRHLATATPINEAPQTSWVSAELPAASPALPAPSPAEYAVVSAGKMFPSLTPPAPMPNAAIVVDPATAAQRTLPSSGAGSPLAAPALPEPPTVSPSLQPTTHKHVHAQPPPPLPPPANPPQFHPPPPLAPPSFAPPQPPPPQLQHSAAVPPPIAPPPFRPLPPPPFVPGFQNVAAAPQQAALVCGVEEDATWHGAEPHNQGSVVADVDAFEEEPDESFFAALDAVDVDGDEAALADSHTGESRSEKEAAPEEEGSTKPMAEEHRHGDVAAASITAPNVAAITPSEQQVQTERDIRPHQTTWMNRHRQEEEEENSNSTETTRASAATENHGESLHGAMLPPPPPIPSVPSSVLSTPPRSTNSSKPNLEAGRRKLEEFKRKKAAKLAKKPAVNVKTATAATALPSSRAGSPTRESAAMAAAAAAAASEVKAAKQRAEDAEEHASRLSRDLDRVLRQLENVDEERTALQRDKAAMLGEIMALQSALDTAASQQQAVGSGGGGPAATTEGMEREEAFDRAQEQVMLLTTRVAELEEALQVARGSVETDAAALLLARAEAAESDAEVARAERAQHEQYAQELGAWAEAVQADAEAAKLEAAELRVALEAAQSMLGGSGGDGQAPRQEQQQHYDAAQRVMLSGQPDAIAACDNGTMAPAEEFQRAGNAANSARNGERELALAQAEADHLREELKHAREELKVLERAHLGSPSSRQGGTGAKQDVKSLQWRLAKAENAVEKERRLVSALERQIKEAEAAAADGRAATAAAFDLRRRCEIAEREAAMAKANAERLEAQFAASGDSSAAKVQAQSNAESLRIAEERTAAAEVAATDLRAQCDAAAITISKLMSENETLADRLNRQGAEIARLNAAMLTAQRFVAAADADALSAEVAAEAVTGVKSPRQRSLLFDHGNNGDAAAGAKTVAHADIQHDHHANQASAATLYQQQASAAGMFVPPHQQATSTLLPWQQQGGTTNAQNTEISRLESQNNASSAASAAYGAGGEFQEVLTPPPPAQQHHPPRAAPAEAGSSNKPRRSRVGFWGWLAGADLVDESEE